MKIGRSLAALVLLTSFGAWATSDAPTSEGRASNGATYLRMKKAAIIDQHGFAKPIPAATLLVPTDWKTQSEVEYYKPGSCRLSGLRFLATGPDGRSLQLFPNYDWGWSDNPASVQFLQRTAQQNAQRGGKVCGVMKPMSAAEFLKGAVAQVMPGYQLVSVDPLPEITQNLQQGAHQREASAARANLHVKVVSDAARARLTGTSPDGKPVEAWLTAIVNNVGTLGPTFMNGRQGQANSYQSEARFMYAFRAPKGHLDASQKLYDTMISSARLDPEWVARTNGVTSNIAAIKAKGERDRAKIRADTQKEINDMRRSSIDYKEAAQDSSNKKADQYLRDTETYRDTSTGQKVELSNQYGHAWKSASGEYLLSDSPNFDPNTVSNQSWSQMQQVDP